MADVEITDVKPWGKGEKMDLQRALEKAGLWIGQAKSFLKTRREFWRKHVKRYDQACAIAWREMEAKYPLEKTVVAPPAAPAPVVAEPVKEVVAKVAADAPAVRGDVPDDFADAEEDDGESPIPNSAVDSSKIRDHVRWVYDHIGYKRIKLKNAPSKGAWNFWNWARTHQHQFYMQFIHKAAKERDEETTDEEAGEVKSIAEIRRIVAQMSSAEKPS